MQEKGFRPTGQEFLQLVSCAGIRPGVRGPVADLPAIGVAAFLCSLDLG